MTATAPPDRRCPHCGAALNDAPGPSGLFSCGGCGAEVDPAALPAEKTPLPKPQVLARPVTPRAPVQLPRHAVLEETAGTLTLRWPWSMGWKSAGGALVATAMFFWFAQSMRHTGQPGLIEAFIGAVWAFTIYRLLCGALNHTRIEVRPTELLVHHGPLPWPGGGRYLPSELDQLYVERVEKKDDESITVTYELRARLKDGRTRVLVKDLEQPDLALYLEQWLEKRYRIKDERVLGELPRE